MVLSVERQRKKYRLLVRFTAELAMKIEQENDISELITSELSAEVFEFFRMTVRKRHLKKRLEGIYRNNLPQLCPSRQYTSIHFQEKLMIALASGFNTLSPYVKEQIALQYKNIQTDKIFLHAPERNWKRFYYNQFKAKFQFVDALIKLGNMGFEEELFTDDLFLKTYKYALYDHDGTETDDGDPVLALLLQRETFDADLNSAVSNLLLKIREQADGVDTIPYATELMFLFTLICMYSSSFSTSTSSFFTLIPFFLK